MVVKWDYPETITYRAKQAFEDEYKALLCTIWCMIEQGKSFHETGNEVGIIPIQAIGMYDHAEKLRLEDWEFREKTKEILNG